MPPGTLLILTHWPDWAGMPMDLAPDEASSVLACWTALWHPALVASHQAMPRLSALPDGDGPAWQEPATVSVPLPISRTWSEAQWSGVRQRSGNVLAGARRREVLAPVRLTGDEPGAGWFFSLGYCWMQVHLMTRGIRFGSAIDEDEFEPLLLAAASQWNADADAGKVRSLLQACFDLLIAEKCRYYPGEASLYRVVLASPGDRVEEIASAIGGSACSLVIPGFDLRSESIDSPPAGEDPTPLPTGSGPGTTSVTRGATGLRELVLDGIRNRSLYLVAGSEPEFLDATVTCGTAARLWKRGFSQPRAEQPESPLAACWNQGTPGPDSPSLLGALGCSLGLFQPFSGTFHGRLSAPHASWKSPSGDELPVLGERPLDGRSGRGWLQLGTAIGEQIDSWHLAHVVIVQEPGSAPDSQLDLENSIGFGAVLGRLRTIASAASSLQPQTWGETPDADSLDSWPRGRDRSQAEAMAARLRRYWYLTTAAGQLSRCLALRTLAGDEVPGLFGQLADLRDRVDLWAAVDPPDSLECGLESDLERLKRSVEGRDDSAVNRAESDAASTVRVVANAGVQPLAVYASGPAEGDSGDTRAGSPPVVRLVEKREGSVAMVAELLGGSVVALPDSGRLAKGGGRAVSLVSGDLLRNEFLTLAFSRDTGGIQSLRRTGERQTLASWRLGARLAGEIPGGVEGRSGEAEGVEMRADRVELRTIGGLAGEAASSGGLFAGDTRWGDFSLTFRLWRGLRWCEIEGEMVPRRSFRGSLWASHFCSRVAWREPDAPRYRYWQSARRRCCLRRFTSPVCTEIETGDGVLSLYHAGNVWHRQSALNILDTILAGADGPGGAVRFRAGLGLDVEHPLETAELLMCGPAWIGLPAQKLPDQGAARLIGWGRNSPLHWYDSAPVTDGDGNPGLSLGLRETAGIGGQMRVKFARPLAQAWLSDPAGRPRSGAACQGDSVLVDWHPWQIFTLSVTWKQ